MAEQFFIVDSKPVDPAALPLLASGGEGRILALSTSQVLKIYHQPDPERVAKIRYLIKLAGKEPLPSAFLGPLSTVTNPSGTVVGYCMARAPAHYVPVRKIATAASNDLTQIFSFLTAAREALASLHRRGIVVGDINDHNILLDPFQPTKHVWIDVDSFQIGPHPCPVASPDFLDPHLYHVDDFSRRPAFTQSSDWYSFYVLMFTLVLGVHPFGGVHPHLKSIRSRAAAGVTVLDPAVRYPPTARPPSILAPALWNLFDQVFCQGFRPAIGEEIFQNIPVSQAKTGLPGLPPIKARVKAAQVPTLASWEAAGGTILNVWPRPINRWRAVGYQDGVYLLLSGGSGGALEKRPIFRGEPGCTLALVGDYLALHRPGRKNLVLLDLRPSSFKSAGFLPCDVVGDGSQAVPSLASSGAALYRASGGFIFRGTGGPNGWLEEIVATALRGGTRLWADPRTDTCAALHLVNGRSTLWIWTARGAYEMTDPLPAGVALPEAYVGFQDDALILSWPTHLGQGGKAIFSLKAQASGLLTPL